MMIRTHLQAGVPRHPASVAQPRALTCSGTWRRSCGSQVERSDRLVTRACTSPYLAPTRACANKPIVENIRGCELVEYAAAMFCHLPRTGRRTRRRKSGGSFVWTLARAFFFCLGPRPPADARALECILGFG